MRFAKTLLKKQVNEWKDWYISYIKLKKIITTNKKEFKMAFKKELAKVNDFYFNLEKQAIQEKSILFDSISKDCKEIDEYSLTDNENKKSNAEYKDFESVTISKKKRSIVENKESVKTKEFLSEQEDNLVLDINDDTYNDEVDDSSSTNSLEELYNQENIDNSIELKSKRSMAKFMNLEFLHFKDQYSKRKKEKSIIEFISTLEEIKRFKELNLTGFKKILKKYDKRSAKKLSKELLPFIVKSYFYKSKRIDIVLRDTKALYRRVFANNDSKKAKMVFQKISKETESDQISSFFAGGFIFLSLFMYYLIDFSNFKKIDGLFKGLNLVFYGVLLFGICMLIFETKFINYRFIYGLDVCSSMNISRYLFFGSVFLLFNNLAFYIYLYYINIKLSLILYIHAFLVVFPLNVFYKRARMFFFFSIAKIVVSPIFSVKFRHFFLADCMQSYVFTYKMLLLYYTTDVNWKWLFLVSILPAWWRILQSLRRYRDTKIFSPHIFNGIKYLVLIIYILFCNLQDVYVDRKFVIIKFTIGFISTFYSLYWDMRIDWGLGTRKRVFNIYICIFISIFNILARLTWIYQHFHREWSFFFAFIEINRRFLWALLRVEHEHLNNCSHLIASRHINLPVEDLFYKKDYDYNNAESFFEGQNNDEKI